MLKILSRGGNALEGWGGAQFALQQGQPCMDSARCGELQRGEEFTLGK